MTRASWSVMNQKAAERGSSGKCGGGLVDEVEAELEVVEVAEAVGLAFEDLDSVVEAKPLAVVPKNSIRAGAGAMGGVARGRRWWVGGSEGVFDN